MTTDTITFESPVVDGNPVDRRGRHRPVNTARRNGLVFVLISSIALWALLLSVLPVWLIAALFAVSLLDLVCCPTCLSGRR